MASLGLRLLLCHCHIMAGTGDLAPLGPLPTKSVSEPTPRSMWNVRDITRVLDTVDRTVCRAVHSLVWSRKKH